MSEPQKKPFEPRLTGENVWEYQATSIKSDQVTLQNIINTCVMKSAPNNDPQDGGEWEFAGFIPVDGCCMLFKRPARKIKKAITL